MRGKTMGRENKEENVIFFSIALTVGYSVWFSIQCVFIIMSMEIAIHIINLNVHRMDDAVDKGITMQHVVRQWCAGGRWKKIDQKVHRSN